MASESFCSVARGFCSVLQYRRCASERPAPCEHFLSAVDTKWVCVCKLMNYSNTSFSSAEDSAGFSYRCWNIYKSTRLTIHSVCSLYEPQHCFTYRFAAPVLYNVFFILSNCFEDVWNDIVFTKIKKTLRRKIGINFGNISHNFWYVVCTEHPTYTERLRMDTQWCDLTTHAFRVTVQIFQTKKLKKHLVCQNDVTKDKTFE